MLNEHKRRTTSPEASQMELRANRARTYASRSSSARSLSPNNSSTNPRIFVPPKPSTRSRSSPWPSLSFGPVKEPSDFVKEVLLNTSDGANNPRALEVITLFEQLQANNKKLQSMYAEAKNTIDSCRMKSETQDPALVSASCPDQHCVHFDPNTEQSLVQSLKSQANTLVQQLYTFLDLLREKTCQPSEYIKGLLQLVEELNALEKRYLIRKVEHELHQQQCKNITAFDSERALEQLISQLRLHMEGLKEQVEHMFQENTTRVLTPSQHPQPSPPSVRTDVEETWKYSQGDSAFAGSESVRLTPAAAHHPHHQMSSQCDLGQLLHHFTLYMTNLRERLEKALQGQPARTVPPPSHQPRPSPTAPDKDKTWRLSKVKHPLLHPETRQQRSMWVDPSGTEPNYQESPADSSVQWSNATDSPPHGPSVQSRPTSAIPPGHKWQNDWRKSNWNGSGHQMAAQSADRRSLTEEFHEFSRTAWTPLV